MQFRRAQFTVFFFFTLLAVAFFGYIVFPYRTVSAQHESAFMTQKKIELTQRITISAIGEPFALVLEKRQSQWKLVIDGAHAFPARQNKIDGLFEELSKKRNCIPVGNANRNRLGIGTTKSFAIALHAETGLLLSRLDFGNTDTSGEWIYYTSGTAPGIFRTETDIIPYLEVNAASWVDLAVFSQRLIRYSIQKITRSTRDASQIFMAGKDPEVSRFEDTLRHLVCTDVTNIDASPSETITIETGNGETSVIQLSPLGDAWIMSDSLTGGSYIISDVMKRSLDQALTGTGERQK